MCNTECYVVVDNVVQRASYCWCEHSVVGGSNCAVSGLMVNDTAR